MNGAELGARLRERDLAAAPAALNLVENRTPAAREQIAVRARDAGMEVVYEGIRLTPSQIARSAVDEGVHVIGLSILSGSHRELIPDVIKALREAGGGDIPLVVGGIIPDADAGPLRAAGVAAVYTPKDFELTRILRDVVAIVAARNGIASAAA